jgi:hypothetical protein
MARALRRFGIQKPKLAIVLLVGVSALSCSGEKERSYALPPDLCGIEVEQGLYADIFPPGDELTVDGMILNEYGSSGCGIYVDGERVAYLASYSGDEMRAVESMPLDLKLSEGTEVPGKFEALAWPGAAIGYGDCTMDDGREGYTLQIGADHPEDDDESMRVLGELLQSLMHATVDTFDCEENKPS